jgi:TP901 family phage tail tape measure protein
LLYQNIADEELSASDASAVLTSQMKAFNIQAQDSTHIIDAINEVSNNFAVSSGDIGQGLTAAGAALNTYGNSFEETIGLVTAGTEIFHGKSQQVARGLNTIASRISTADEALGKYGITVKDSSGELKSTYDVLAELKPKWDEMTSAEQTALGKTLAGVNQYKILSAVMQNFSTAIDANNTALNSSGSATRENAAYMESLQAKITNLKATYENIILGDGGISDFAKKMLDSANSILKFIDYGNNLQAVLGAIVGVLITIKAQKVSSMITTMIQPLKQLATILAQNLLKSLPSVVSHLAGYKGNVLAVAAAEETATVATSGLKLSLDTLTAGIGILTTVISLIVMASNKAQQAQEQAQQQQISNLQTYTETADKYKDLEQQLNKTSLTQEEFNSIIKNNPEIWGEYRGEVEKTGESLTKYKQILESVAAGKAEDTFRSNIGAFKDSLGRSTNLTGQTVGSWLGGAAGEAGTSMSAAGISSFGKEAVEWGNVNSIDEAIEKLKAHQQALQDDANAATENSLQQQKLNDQADATGLIIGQLTQQKEQDLEVMKAMVAAYDAAPEKLSQYKDIVEQARDAIKESEPAQKETTKTVAEMAAELGLTEDKFNAFAKSQKMSTDEAYNWISAAQKSTKNAKSMSDTLSDLNSDLDLATKAYKEYNENGAVNADTLQKLLSLEPEYLSALIDSNGQININSQSLQDMAKLMKNAAIADLQDAAAKDVLAIATGKTTELSGLAQGAIDGMNGKIGDTSKYAQVAAGDMAGFTASIYAAASASQGKKLDVASLSKDQQKEINAVVGSYYSVAKSFSKISIATTTSTKATHRNTSATNKNTDAKERNRKKNKELSDEIDRQTKKLEKQKDKLQDNIDAWNKQADEMEKLFSIVIDRIEEKIESLQEKNDKYQEKIDARTEKFEKAKEKEEKALDKKIDAIDKEIAAQQEANDAVDDAIELQEKLENLRKAQSTKVKVFKDGQWTWGTDQVAVDEAQKELDEYNRAKAQENAIAELERAKELLETQKDSLDAKYEALVANDKLINKWQSIIDKNNEEIALLEKQKKEVEDISKMYERMEENAILKKYLDTDKIFGTKGLKHSVIPALQKVENEYINIQDYIKDAEEEVKRFEKAISGLNDLSSQVGNSEGSISGGWVQRQIDKWLNKLNPKRKSKKKKKKKKHASGVANVANDEIALVGESPYEEMIIGSKYNTGTVAQLSKGSGVVNAAATNTLAGILNTFAKSNFGAGNGILNNNNRDLSTIINISNLNVETQNGEQFVNYLQDFAMKMRQESYKNK